jgi:uncharacterized protein YegP (UPF0339 family)
MKLNSIPLLYTLLIGLFLLPILLVGQDSEMNKDHSTPSSNEFNRWNVTLNGGPTLIWADLSDEMASPFAKLFSPQMGYGYGLIITRKLNPSFSVNLDYLGGFMQGTKTAWSDNSSADRNFKTSFNEFSLNVEVDAMNLLFENKDQRWFAPYAKFGFGYNFYNPSIYQTSTSTLISSASYNHYFIPWGGGIRTDLNKHWSLRLESTFQHTLTDDVDGYASTFSDVDDIYNFTSIGVTYHIYSTPKTKKLKEEPPVVVDTAVAVVEKDSFELSIAASFPSRLYINDSTLIKVRINKGELQGKGTFQINIPESFIVKNYESGEATFKFNNQLLTYYWSEMGSEEFLTVAFYLISNNSIAKLYDFSGLMLYNQNDIEQIRQFKKTLEMVQSVQIVKTDSTTLTANKVGPPLNQTDSLGKVIYRVQVYAVYGGTTSPKMLQNRLNLDYEVQQEYQGNYAKYTSGEFSSYAEAVAYKQKLRNSTVPGAFVVGYYEGERKNNIQEVIAIEKGATPSSTSSKSKATEYRIQLAASNLPMNINDFKKTKHLDLSIEMIEHNGLYKLETGHYKSKEEAKSVLNSIRSKIADAFIVNYLNGERIK